MSVPLSTIKAALKIEYDEDDLELIRLRETASSLIERETGLSMTPGKREMYLAGWTDTAVAFTPFTSVFAVIYVDSAGSNATMPSTDYWVDYAQGPIPILRFLESPAIKEGTNITVTVTCGYETLPNELVHAIIALTGAWYNNPEAFQPIGLSMVPMSLQYIIESLRVRSYIR